MGGGGGGQCLKMGCAHVCQLAMMMILSKLVHLGFAYITRCILNLDYSIDWPQTSDRFAYIGPEHSVRVLLLGQIYSILTFDR
jgi:hypothetical protein